jgi:hypothetical protein
LRELSALLPKIADEEERQDKIEAARKKRGWRAMNIPATHGDSEVRGRLRQWKSKLVAGNDRLDRLAATNALDSDTATLALAGNAPSPGVQEARCDRCGTGERQQTGRAPIALWAILKPRISVAIAPDDPADGQNCVAVNYFVAGELDGIPRRADGLPDGRRRWSLSRRGGRLGR